MPPLPRRHTIALILTALLAVPVAAQDTVPRLRAEIQGPRAIRVEWVDTQRPAVPALRLTDGAGRAVGVEAVRPITATASLLVPQGQIDPSRVFFVIDPDSDLRARARRDPWFRTLYSTKELGATVAADRSETAFRLFAPRADSVLLYLYHEPEGDAPALVAAMARDPDGIWETVRTGDHAGLYYDFTIHGPKDPGNWFHGTTSTHISDPYALVNVGSFGRSRVWVDGPPPPPVRGGRPPMESVVAYEVHVQDFTDLLPLDPTLQGTLPAMHRAGLTNRAGQPVGIDYLTDLGVNVVHLMPVQEYLHYPDADWQADMANDPFAVDMGIDRENYQWGYRTTHAFAVESKLRDPRTDWGQEREQFKALVAAFHERGISVVIDVVPNHTGENMDGRHLLLNFNAIDLPYYYRTNDDVEHIGPFGNEVKTEDRPMVQRWVVDQLTHWVEELGVDGFRIDLAGQIDEQTLHLVNRELPDDVIIYGEPWIAPSDPDTRANPDWAWYKADAPITFFQDDARNAFKGSPFSLEDRGWAGGDISARERVIQALANTYEEEDSPNDGISYLDIHDNWTLADRYATAEYDGRGGVDEASIRLAAGLLLTSLGPVVLHGGTEMMRTKGLAQIEEFERHVAGGTIYFKGRGDTYNVRAPNRFDWERLAETNVTDMRDHWRGLIALRMSGYGEVLRTSHAPRDHFSWFVPEDQTLLAYSIANTILVAANVGSDAGNVQVSLPSGGWRLVSNGTMVHHETGVSGRYPRLDAGQHTLEIPPRSMLIWVRE